MQSSLAFAEKENSAAKSWIWIQIFIKIYGPSLWWFFIDHALIVYILCHPRYPVICILFFWSRQIIYAEGPSGPNRDYLFQLENALLEMGKVLLRTFSIIYYWIFQFFPVNWKNFPFTLVFIFSLFFFVIIFSVGCKDKHVMDLANEVRRIVSMGSWLLHEVMNKRQNVYELEQPSHFSTKRFKNIIWTWSRKEKKAEMLRFTRTRIFI